MVLSSTEQPFTSVFLVLEAFPKPSSHEREATCAPAPKFQRRLPFAPFRRAYLSDNHHGERTRINSRVLNSMGNPPVACLCQVGSIPLQAKAARPSPSSLSVQGQRRRCRRRRGNQTWRLRRACALGRPPSPSPPQPSRADVTSGFHRRWSRHKHTPEAAARASTVAQRDEESREPLRAPHARRTSLRSRLVLEKEPGTVLAMSSAADEGGT